MRRGRDLPGEFVVRVAADQRSDVAALLVAEAKLN